MTQNFKLFLGALALVLFAAVLSSCTANKLRVTEYEGAALPVPGMNAAAGGCQVSQDGAITGRLVYIGDKCHYDSQPNSKE